MNKKGNRFFNFTNLICFLISFLVCGIFFVLLMLLFGFNMYGSINASFISGFVFVCIGGLVFCGNVGTFDVFIVGFSNLIAVSQKNGKKKYNSTFDYTDSKKIDRKSNRFLCLFIIFAGLIYLILSLILYLVLYYG